MSTSADPRLFLARIIVVAQGGVDSIVYFQMQLQSQAADSHELICGGGSHGDTASSRAPCVVRILLVALGTSLILFLRRPDAFLNPQFWAEDFFFLLDAEKIGPAAIGMPLALGYLHLLPRIIASFAPYLDPALQPGSFVLFSLIGTIGVVLLCLSRRHHLPFKLWLGTAILVVPHSGEVFLTPTNLQWIAALGLALTAISDDPARPLEWVTDIAVIVLAGLSGPFAIFALPLFAYRAWRSRSLPAYVLLAIVGCCAGIQGWLVAHAPADREFVGPFSSLDLLAGLSHRIAANLFAGVYAASIGKLATILIGGGIAGFVAVSVYFAPRHRTELTLLLAFVVVLLLSATLRKRFDLWAFSSMESGDRYFFIPKVILLWVLGVIFWTHSIAWLKYGAGVLMLLCILLNAPRFPFFPYHDFGWHEKCPAIRRGELVYLEINPEWKFRYRRGSMESYGPLP